VRCAAVRVQTDGFVTRAAVALVGFTLAAWPGAGRSGPSAMPAAGLDHQAVVGAVAASTGRAAASMPTEWMPARGRECASSGRRKGFCQGPRRVPKPLGPEADLARDLGLGTLEAAGDLLFEAPKPEWIEAAGPEAQEPLLFPVSDGYVWRGLQKARRTKSGFHHRHKGVDIGAPEGTPIQAVRSGIVAYSDNGVHGYGNLLVTVHADGSVAVYGHCRAVYVFPGQHVAQGQVVGEVGHTGVARGTHLHFEYRENGKLKDPLPRFTKPGA
jgi:murein DD-endopeptidase MepM/ murein hydrolase activator NlpD